MSTAPYLIDDSARAEEADVWFALPPGFVALPLLELMKAGNGPEELGPGGTLSSLLDVFPDPASRQRLLAEIAPVRRMAQMLLETGTIHCSLGLHADDEGDGGLLLSLFTLAWRVTDWAPRSVLAARAAAGADDAEHIETLDLPCGPASLVQSRMTGPLEAGLAAHRQLLQVTAYVPCPDGRRIAILTLATTAVERARHYRSLLLDIARMVSFDNPLPDTPDEE
ncbi:hypothetical protein ACIPC1_35075 [Streptomyces sp. NPDC087263]|uniref:hypothetical protein n=1 Tax=Streptomyces sp. NPDC087263 TaxID=3365773 RepID=UPI003829237C